MDIEVELGVWVRAVLLSGRSAGPVAGCVRVPDLEAPRLVHLAARVTGERSGVVTRAGCAITAGLGGEF